MFDIKNKVASEICFGGESLNNEKWIKEEVSDLALRYSGLDEIPIAAIFSLSQLAARGPLDDRFLAREIGLNLSDVEECLEALSEHDFIKVCPSGYETTLKGMEAFRSFGRNLVIRKRLEMKARLEYLDALYKHLDEI